MEIWQCSKRTKVKSNVHFPFYGKEQQYTPSDRKTILH